MHLQLRLNVRIWKRRKKRKSCVTKQLLKFRDFQGSEDSSPDLECSPHPSKDLGIPGLEETLKVTHSEQPPMQEFPLKPPQQVANPPHPPECFQRRRAQSLTRQPWLFFPMSLKAVGVGVGGHKTSATIVQFGKPFAWEAWGYFHGAALKYSGMCRVKKKKNLHQLTGIPARSLPNTDTHSHTSLPRFHLAAGPQLHLFSWLPKQGSQRHTQTMMHTQKYLLMTKGWGRC